MQPRLTQVPPSAASSATATRAPRCAAMRAARTPPLPAPMTKRSNARDRPSWSRILGSGERLGQQLGDQAVQAVGMAGALFAQGRGERGRQLARERHQPGSGIEAALLAPVGQRRRRLARSGPERRRSSSGRRSSSEVLVEIGLLHAHRASPAAVRRRDCARAVAQSADGPESDRLQGRRCSSPTSTARSTAITRSPSRAIRRKPTSG